MSDIHIHHQHLRDFFAGKIVPSPRKPLHPWFRRAWDRDAAVFVGIADKGEPRVLLTMRSASMSKHASEVAFAGGMVDETDAGSRHTALRELSEELGIGEHSVEVLGTLRPMVTRYDVRVTPVVGFYDSDAPIVINPAEIASAFEVPIDYLLDPANVSLDEGSFLGRSTLMPSYHYEGYKIWGVTAYILIDFLTHVWDVELPSFQLNE